MDPNRRYHFPDATSDPNDEPFHEVERQLPQYVTVDSITAGAGCPPVSGIADIVFTPPRAAIYACGTLAPVNVSVVLRHAQTNSTKTVRLNGVTGMVSPD